jgi:hypothetical protein
LNFKRDETGNISQLAFDFMYHCEKNNHPFFGSFRYKSDVANDLTEYYRQHTDRTGAEIYSQKDDPVGNGTHITLSKNNKYFSAATDSKHSIAFINYYNMPSWWQFRFAAPDSKILTEVYYTDAVRALFNRDKPGIEILGDYYACGDDLLGRFHILQLNYTPERFLQNSKKRMIL